jgi:hypothetical protein
MGSLVEELRVRFERHVEAWRRVKAWRKEILGKPNSNSSLLHVKFVSSLDKEPSTKEAL